MQDQLFQQAHGRHMAGERQAARALYEQILQQNPKHVDALYMLGTLMAESGDLVAALARLKAAARLSPNSPLIQTNLGNVLLMQGQLDQARDCFQRALRANSQVAETHYNLGQVLFRQGQAAKAAGHLSRAVELRPDFFAGYLTLSRVLKQLGQVAGARSCLERAVELSPSSTEAWLDLGNLCAAGGDHAAAESCFQRIVELEPDNASARHALAALRGETPESAPREHVASLFDDLAESFERHLGDLGYRAPERLRAWVVSWGGDAVHFDHALDLGCGTGAIGQLFRPLVGRLVGLDLSAKMIEQARAKGVYDELAVADIGEYLSERDNRYELVIAADVFVYVGELDGIFGIVARHMDEGGLFLFSTEQGDAADYVLRKTGRYAHSHAYICRLATHHGFEVLRSESGDLRREGQGTLVGELFMLRRSGA